jgi:hypothetical protein
LGSKGKGVAKGKRSPRSSSPMPPGRTHCPQDGLSPPAKGPRAAWECKAVCDEEMACPGAVHCDFCGRVFKPVAVRQRTCVACAADGAPDQSKGTWKAYLEAARAYIDGRGVRRPEIARGGRVRRER